MSKSSVSTPYSIGFGAGYHRGNIDIPVGENLCPYIDNSTEEADWINGYADGIQAYYIHMVTLVLLVCPGIGIIFGCIIVALTH